MAVTIFGWACPRMAGSPGADVVEEFVAIHGVDVRAVGAVHEERVAADGAEGADG